MSSLDMRQFYGLIKREILEHKNLFIAAPLVIGALMLVTVIWVLTQIDRNSLVEGLQYLSTAVNGLSPFDMAPLLMMMALPFLVTLYFCGIIYLINTLYSDRKELSILFWQSMPVSNLKTVVSKIITLALVAPLFYLAVMLVIFVFTSLVVSSLAMGNDIDMAGVGSMFAASIISLVLAYLSCILTVLWLFPTIGWILLFSAFAKKSPLLWAPGVFILILFLEDFIFSSRFLLNWTLSRADPNQYIIVDFTTVLERLVNYDMVFGLLTGSMLIAGAVYMRRFID